MNIDSAAHLGERKTLDEIRPQSDSTLRSYNVLVGRNLGNMTLTMALPMYQFFGMSHVANDAGLAERGIEEQGEVAQRKLDSSHAKRLALYLLRALIDNARTDIERAGRTAPDFLIALQESLVGQPYFATQPIVANLRNVRPGGGDLQVESIAPGFARVFLSEADVLWVIDGQHRRFAMDFLFEFLKATIQTKRYAKKGGLYAPEGRQEVTAEELAVWNELFKTARQGCNVVVDVHLGLTPEQERQVFHDLNNLSKPVAASLAHQFDSSNPINTFIKDELLDGEILGCAVAESDITDWHRDDGAIAYKDLVAVNARLLANKSGIAAIVPGDVKPRLPVAREFWRQVAKIPGWGKPGAKTTTVAAQPVLLKGLARVVYDFAFGREADAALLAKVLEQIPNIDFSHANRCWQYYQMSSEDRLRLLPGLEGYLPPVGDGANRDIGGWDADAGLFRYGAKHNDILLLLADMIRWMALLPSRYQHASSAGE